MRIAIPEDIDFDPSFTRQRMMYRYLLGIALNRLPSTRPERRLFDSTQQPTREELICIALQHGLIEYTPWHHAPLCKSNDWSKQMLPEGPCTCGAEFHQIRLCDR